MKHKYLTYELGGLGAIVQALITNGAKRTQVNYVDGTDLESDIKILKMELAPEQSKIKFLAQSESYPDVSVPTEVALDMTLTSISDIEVV